MPKANSDQIALARAIEQLKAEVLERDQLNLAARKRVATLAKTLQILATEPERDQFIGHVLKATAEQLGAQSGGFWCVDPITGNVCLYLDYVAGLVRQDSSLNTLTKASNLSWNIVESFAGLEKHMCLREFTIYEDVSSDVRLELWRDELLSKGIHALIVIPLFLEDEFLGSFSIHSSETQLRPPEEIDLAQALAQQAVLAIQIDRLAEQSRLTAQIEERNRIVREVHDTLAQSFTGILIQLGVAQRIFQKNPLDARDLIEHVADLARQGLAELRRSVWEVQPDALEYSDLANTLPRKVAIITLDSGLHTEVQIHGTPRLLPADIGHNLLRIGQEALNNVIKSANAQNVYLELTFGEENVRLFVQDDGDGFDPLTLNDGCGFGLIGMQQRVDRIGGKLSIVSRPKLGTEVAVTVPLPTASKREITL